MLKIKVRIKKRHAVMFSILLAASIATGGGVFAMQFYGNQAIAQQASKASDDIKKIDAKIAEVKAKKIAEQKAKEEAERKAKEKVKKDAERKASAEAALQAQLAGKVVTPAHCAISGAHGNPNSIDVVVNKKNCFNPINFVPSDLVSYGGYLISNKVHADLVAMRNAAAAANKPLSLASSYRSYDNQVVTYNNWVAVNGSTAAADKVSARPGYSEHQTGFAIDFAVGGCSLECFATTAQYTWMKANAHKYGFVERYQAGYESITGYNAEAWHWRYIGKTAATAMKSGGIKTLEQYWNVEGCDY